MWWGSGCQTDESQRKKAGKQQRRSQSGREITQTKLNFTPGGAGSEETFTHFNPFMFKMWAERGRGGEKVVCLDSGLEFQTAKDTDNAVKNT